MSLTSFVDRWPSGSRPARAGARVASVTSSGRHAASPSTQTTRTSSGSYDPLAGLRAVQAANLHVALELDRRFRAAGLPARSIVVHPGFANTDQQARSLRETGGGASQRLFHAAVRRFGMTPAQGALPLLRAATDPLAGAAPSTPRWVN